MPEIQNTKTYDLEERTFAFAKQVRAYVRTLPKTLPATEDARQVVRSSGSIGANYIEANESLSRKDFALRVKISRKEAKETVYWLRLLNAPQELIQEGTEIMKIFGAIVSKNNS